MTELYNSTKNCSPGTTVTAVATIVRLAAVVAAAVVAAGQHGVELSFSATVQQHCPRVQEAGGTHIQLHQFKKYPIFLCRSVKRHS